MLIIDPVILNLAVALGIGLLIGAERERRKGDGPSRSPAGIRTFTVASLAGATSFIVGSEALLAVVTAGVIILTAVAYWRAHEDDPGLTTEIALIVTALLGGLSIQQPALAAGLAVTVAVLLAARSRLHRFVGSVLTEDELQDALILAGATLVVLPLVPDRAMGPYGALNPHSIWIIVILVMAISAAGYIAVRMLGRRFGLPIAGLASGFISSTATIGAMGARVAKAADVLAAAVAGAVLSTIATIVQMAIVLAATSMTTLRVLSVPLICAGLAALADALDDAVEAAAVGLISEANQIVAQQIVEHERNDENAVYPRLAKFLSDGHGLGAMSRAHREIIHFARLLRRLADGLTPADADRYLIRDAQRVIESIEALVRIHNAQEEDIYEHAIAN